MLAVSERHVRDLVSRGAIRSVKVGRGYRFRTMWVQEFIDREEHHGWPDGGDDRR
jgi:excisionase family DNA binding protein